MSDSESQALRIAAEDPLGREARRELPRRLVPALLSIGQDLRVGGWMHGTDRIQHVSPFGNGDDGVVALGYVVEVAAALLSGASAALDAGNLYAAAALVRQVVEAEYLAWAFADDRDEAADWLRSTREQRLQRWQPRHLRQRSDGRFRGSDYHLHCEFGGHPTPGGARSYLNCSHDKALLFTEVLWFELSSHGQSMWRYTCHALEDFGYDFLLLAEVGHQAPGSAALVAPAADNWLASERMQPRLDQVPTA